MFTTLPKNPAEMFKLTSEYFSAFPKSEAEMKVFLEKVKTVFQEEFAQNKDMWEIYQKATTGDATVNEIARANKLAQASLTTARFATILAIPGTVFILPALIKLAEEYDIDLVPASVSEAFDIK